MTRFSANLGFLYTDRPVQDAIHAAHAAGVDAGECHWPYETPASETRTALEATGLRMLGLNTVRGNPGENGLCALPGRQAEAKAAIAQAIDYADAIDAGAVHIMAGFAQGPEAQAVYEDNLRLACTSTDRVILIEPLNRHDAPGYFLQTTDQARAIIETLDLPNLKLMFDCYHMQLMEGDLTHRIKDILPIIGHIQFASVPDRGTPDHGEVNYAHIFAHLDALGWDMPLGAEYKPTAPTVETLGWMELYSSKSSE